VVGSDIGGVAVEVAVPVAPLTTLRLGPVASRLITCDTTDKVVDVLRELPADDPAERTLVLAGGSNVVIADDLTDLTVVRLANT
jgi:UDP-N-acetylmuramate dehydrogenase